MGGWERVWCCGRVREGVVWEDGRCGVVGVREGVVWEDGRCGVVGGWEGVVWEGKRGCGVVGG